VAQSRAEGLHHAFSDHLGGPDEQGDATEKVEKKRVSGHRYQTSETAIMREKVFSSQTKTQCSGSIRGKDG
jgi:hypothetical protein